MGLSRNKVAVSEGAAGSPPFYGERVIRRNSVLRSLTKDKTVNEKKKRWIVVQYSRMKTLRVSATNAEGPPVPIPNTEVKLCSGENTMRDTAWEDSPVLTFSKERRNPFLH